MRSTPIPRLLRLIGLLPLSFFLIHLGYRLHQGRVAEVLWLCHISTLVLAIGLLTARPALIRFAVNWLVPGLFLWIVDVVTSGEIGATTIISHLGAVTIGLLAMARIGAQRASWIYAFCGGLLIQLICRCCTPPALNINVAHSIYPGLERFFCCYWQYWLANTLFTAGYLWFTEMVLIKLFPPKVN